MLFRSVGVYPIGVSVSPDSSRIYVTNYPFGDVSVINAATNTVTATITVGEGLIGVSVSPNGSRVYVANQNSGNVSVINTATNTVIDSVAAGAAPQAFGNFIKAGSTVSTENTAPETINKNLDIKLYPNPTQGQFTLAAENNAVLENVTVVVYNLLGQVVTTQTISGRTATLDLTNQPQGMYFVQLRAANGNEVTKKIQKM